MAPWALAAAVLLPLPLRQAAGARAVVTVLLVLRLPTVMQRSMSSCSLSAPRYRLLGQAVDLMAASTAPLHGASLTLPLERSDALGFYVASLYLQLLVTCALPLALLYRDERRQRAAFARRHRLAAEAACLRRQHWMWGGVALLLVLGPAGAACLACHIGLVLGWV